MLQSSDEMRKRPITFACKHDYTTFIDSLVKYILTGHLIPTNSTKKYLSNIIIIIQKNFYK